MSVNFNQTNINETTAFASGGGSITGSNILVASVQVLPAQTSPILSEAIQGGFVAYGGNNQLSVVRKSDSTLGPLQIGGTLEVQQEGAALASFYRMLYTAEAINWQQATTGTVYPFMTLNSNTTDFNLKGLSTIQAGGNTANAVSLFSSLKGTFPTSFQ